MLVVSLFPMLLYAGIAYKGVRDSTLQTTVSTVAALFEENMNSYEQKVDRLFNTALDITSDTSLRLLFKPIKENVSPNKTTTFQRLQIVRNYSLVERCVDAHFAAQRDLLDGIGLLADGNAYATISVGDFTRSPAAIEESYGKIGMPMLSMNFDAGKPLLSVSLAFCALDPGNVLGACVLNVTTENLFKTLLPPELSQGEQLFVLDSSDRILFHTNRALIGEPYCDAGLRQGEADVVVTSYLAETEGETYIVTCQRMRSAPGWTAYYVRPYTYFIQSSEQMAGMFLPFALLCAAMAVIAALAFAWLVYKPVRRLTRSISRMSGRNLAPLPPQKTPSEIALLTSSFNRLVEDINSLLREVEAEAENTRKAEIIALRAQVSPHFLYNTLNVVKVLAAQHKTDEIQIAITGLISLLRASIGDARDVVPLKQEIEYVDNYLILQRYRLDLTFTYEAVVEDGAEFLTVPRFVLQPLIENALLHAFADITREANAIRVHARARDSVLIVSVSDNGRGVAEDERQMLNQQFAEATHVWRNKVGLHNVIERARRLFGTAARLYIVNTEHGAKITLELPATPCADEPAQNGPDLGTARPDAFGP